MRRLALSFIPLLCILYSCTSINHIADVQSNTVRLDTLMLLEDKSMESKIAPYRDELLAQMNVPIATLDSDLKKASPNSTLGNWFADILHNAGEKIFETEVDFALQNSGGLRIPGIKQGAITVGQIYELMPFDNTLQLVYLEAKDIRLLTAKMVDKGGWPISHGLEMSVLDSTVQSIKIKGKPLEENTSYKVIIPDYIANGGDNCNFLIPLKREESPKMIRDVVIEYLKEQTKDSITQSAITTKRFIRL